MKKLSLLSAALMVIVATTFANTEPGPASKKQTAAFSKHFSAAQSVSWNQVAMITTANFILDGEYLSAHFSPEAKMLGISRNVAVDELPLKLTLELKSYIDKYWISDIFEYATPASDTYYVTLENADTKLVLKSEGSGFDVYKKTTKNS